MSKTVSVSPQELENQISRIKSSRVFSGAKQLHLFLDLLANRAFSCNGGPLSQMQIGRALGLHQFDSTKPTVRIAAARLRLHLMEFYATDGRQDHIIVEFPKGSPYRLTFRKRDSHALPSSPRVIRLCRDGRMFWARRTSDSLQKAICCFEEAIRIDPEYSEPHAALAECYLFLALGGTRPRSVMRKAKMHAQLAVRIDPNSAEAHAALGSIQSAFDWDWKKAGREFQRAVQLDPKSVAVYCLRATHLVSIGKTEDAANDARRVLEMTAAGPSPLIASHAAKILYVAGKFDESEELLLRTEEIAPDFYMAHWQLGLLYGAKGDFAAARSSMKAASRLSPGSPIMIAGLGWINALEGRVDSALEIASQLQVLGRHQYVPSTDLAIIYGALGRMEVAFHWLERALRERSVILPWLGVWPPFQPLFCDPRSAAILEKMALHGASDSAS